MKGHCDYRCVGEECEEVFEIEFEYTRPIPAQTYGPPESCYDAEGGDCDVVGPTECPKCKLLVNLEKAVEKFWEEYDQADGINERDFEE